MSRKQAKDDSLARTARERFWDHVAVVVRERGITHAELARRLKVSRPLVSRFLSGENVKLDTAEKIARALGCFVSIKLVEEN